MNNKVSIGVLAFNEERHIEKVISELLIFDLPIYIIDDKSTDNTLKIIEKFKNIEKIKIIKNNKNIGAGESTKILINSANEDGSKFLIKVDGDGQFLVSDIKRIIDIYNQDDYEFIKSNRFWDGGIKGDIPKVRFFGNLVATLFMQISTGTNKLYDPLNGLFGISLSISNQLNDKSFPKRYGYPYYLTLAAVINNFRTYQINNVVKYDGQSSNLNSLKVFFTILKLSLIFYFRKLTIKKKVGIYQRSAFFDILFLWFLLFTLICSGFLIYIPFYASTSLISTVNLLIISILLLFTSVLFFVLSFKEEKNIRKEYIDIDK